MPVVIVKRITKGAPLTPAEHDQNLQNLKDACDDNSLAVTGRITAETFNAAFSGTSGEGKKQIEWENVLDVPSGSLLPSGALLDFAGLTPPSGFLLCDGSAVSRTTYASLFTVLGSVYGAGDGINTFNLPDFRGRVAVGRGSGDASGATAWSVGQKRGEETHVLTAAELAKHKHFAARSGSPSTAVTLSSTQAINATSNFDSGNVDYSLFSSNAGDADRAPTSESGSDTAHNNLQPSLGITKIIKT